MSKKIIIGSVVGLGVLFVLIAASFDLADKEAVAENRVEPQKQEAEQKKSADKIQLFLFHTTKRCATCIAIGRLSNDTVNEHFQSELRSGKIEFREINIDLPENKELAEKFRASGSALFVNAIYGEQDNISEDTRVWRLTQNEAQFKNYLKNKLDSLLGK